MMNTYKSYIIVLEDFDRVPCVLTTGATISSIAYYCLGGRRIWKIRQLSGQTVQRPCQLQG